MTALGRTGLLVVVVGLLAALVLTGTGGFGFATADRTVSADVVPDEDALFGVRVSETSGVVGGSTFTLIKTIDNSGGQVDVDSATVTGPVSVVTAGPDTVEVVCTAPTNAAQVTLTVKASGADVQITTYRDVTVTCATPTPTPTPQPHS
jgi:hypothetical protein